jgi:hypothetical protein
MGGLLLGQGRKEEKRTDKEHEHYNQWDYSRHGAAFAERERRCIALF